MMAAKTSEELMADAPDSLTSALTRFAEQAIKHNGGGGKTRMSISDAFKKAGVDPRKFFGVTSMQGRLSGAELQKYDAVVDSILNASYEDGTRNPTAVINGLAELIDYQSAALEEVARNFETLSDPNASKQDKDKARASIDELGQRDMGDRLDPNSPLAGFREKGEAYFNDDARYARDPEDLAQMLDDPEQFDAEDYLVADALDQRGRAYRENRQNIDYEDVPTRDLASVADIAAREVGADELIDPAIADYLISKWEDQDFVDNIDMSGQQAMARSLQYFDDVVANDGRDAVTEAHMNRMTREAEMRRRAGVDAALAKLDARGMSGSGGQLQAYLQGAGQSQAAQFDAAMEAAAMAQQRKDAAAEQRAVHGRAMQLLEEGRAKTMADAIDMATRERTQMRWNTEQANADKATNAADQNFEWEGTQARDNARLQDSAYHDQFEGARQEAFARNRDAEASERQIYTTGVGGTLQDSVTRRSVDEGNRAATEAGKAAAVGQVNTATQLGIQQQQVDQQNPDDANFWDYLGAVAGFVPGAAQTIDAVGGLFDDDKKKKGGG